MRAKTSPRRGKRVANETNGRIGVPFTTISGASFWTLRMLQRMTLEKLRLAPDDERRTVVRADQLVNTRC